MTRGTAQTHIKIGGVDIDSAGFLLNPGAKGAVGCDVHGDEGRILSLLHAVFYTRVETNLPISKILSLPSRPSPPGLHLSSSGICSFLFPFVTLPPPHTQSIQRAPHNHVTKTDEDITRRSQSLGALERSSRSLSEDLHTHETSLYKPYRVLQQADLFYHLLHRLRDLRRKADSSSEMFAFDGIHDQAWRELL
jgi:hypothetical protein